MHTETFDLLYLLAEVSIATVALCGITMVLVAANQQLSSEQIARIVSQLAMSSVVVVFSIFPLLLNRIFDEVEITWLIASAAYLVVVIAGNLSRFRQSGLLKNLNTRYRTVTGVAAVSAVLLLGVNIWLKTDFPYLIQLFVAWICSIVLFGGFIYETLSEKGT
jgi:hypothetical protein